MDFPEDESPWGSHSPTEDISPSVAASFAIEEDVAAPWGGTVSDDDDNDVSTTSAAMTSSYNPYISSNVETISNPLMSESSFMHPHSDEGEETQEVEEREVAAALPEADVPAVTESAPQAVHKKNVNLTRAKKKNRGGSVKTISVESDPLAAKDSPLENVELTSKLASVDLNTHAADAPIHRADPLGAEPNPLDPPSEWSEQYVFESGRSHTETVGEPEQDQTEQPADFEISVGDAVTVGDLGNAHTEYTIVMNTTLESYKIKESAVQRRYRDFRWLYRTLEHNHPGVVVPPPPEKQALGRFNDDFVQFRRAALEKMLVKITRHPALKTDRDLEEFLTSTDFGAYVENREKGDVDLQKANVAPHGADGEVASGSSSSSSGGALGFIGSLTGALMLSRGNEVDPWTQEKRQQLNKLEVSLKQVIKDFISLSHQRQQLSESLHEYANVIRVLSDIDVTRKLTTVLRSFAKVQERLSEISDRLRREGIMELEANLDEYLRLIGSIRDAINTRQKVFTVAEEAASELEKKQQALDKLIKSGSTTQQDIQLGIEQDVEELTKKASDLHEKSANIARLVDSEIKRVTDEKISEFRNSVDLYLKSTIEAHKETIEVWETFYTRNFVAAKS